MLRKVTRWHKVGHKIDSGDRAGKPLHFFTKDRAAAIKKLWVDVAGVDDYVSNFDEDIQYPWPEAKMFSADYYQSSTKRLEDWGGPLAIMLRAQGVMPYLMPLLRAQAMEDRRKMKAFLVPLINESFAPPVPMNIAWSNMIFNEARLAAELVKFGATNGMLSVETTTDAIGADSKVEAERKLAEANDKEFKKKFAPIYDASHGSFPMEAEPEPPAGGKGPSPTAQPGKPPGTTAQSP
jgi:hypothetical protein